MYRVLLGIQSGPGWLIEEEKKKENKIRLLDLCMANDCVWRENEVSGTLSTPSMEAYTHLWSWVPALIACVQVGFTRGPGQGALSFA